MSFITRNLPWFIRDPGVYIIGEQCYVSLVENLNIFSDIPCLKYSFSKAIGIGIVIGGSIMKVPQVALILNARSARGLSFSSYILETSAYGINLMYSFRRDFPFSTYGENFFLTLQNILITLLIIAYSPRLTRKKRDRDLATTSLGVSLSAIFMAIAPMSIMTFLQFSTLPLGLFSKLPQIRQNYRSKSTGQLSVFAVASQVLGCIARLFTTATEVGDSLVAASFALALLLNVILGFQLWQYWGQDGVDRLEYELGNGVSTARETPLSKRLRKDHAHVLPAPVSSP